MNLFTCTAVCQLFGQISVKRAHSVTVLLWYFHQLLVARHVRRYELRECACVHAVVVILADLHVSSDSETHLTTRRHFVSNLQVARISFTQLTASDREPELAPLKKWLADLICFQVLRTGRNTSPVGRSIVETAPVSKNQACPVNSPLAQGLLDLLISGARLVLLASCLYLVSSAEHSSLEHVIMSVQQVANCEVSCQ